MQKELLLPKGKTDANGKLVVDSLFMGKYELKETLTNEGYVLSEKVHQINLEQKDITTKRICHYKECNEHCTSW